MKVFLNVQWNKTMKLDMLIITMYNDMWKPARRKYIKWN